MHHTCHCWLLYLLLLPLVLEVEVVYFTNYTFVITHKLWTCLSWTYFPLKAEKVVHPLIMITVKIKEGINAVNSSDRISLKSVLGPAIINKGQLSDTSSSSKGLDVSSLQLSWKAPQIIAGRQREGKRKLVFKWFDSQRSSDPMNVKERRHRDMVKAYSA